METHPRGARLLPRFKVPRVLKHHGVLAALLLASCLAFTYRGVVFRGQTFLSLSRTLGTLPPGTLRPELTGMITYGYPGPLPVPGRDPTLDTGALGWVIEPFQFYSRRVFRRGEIPLWNPHIGCGESQIGAGQSSVLDPLGLMVYLAPRRWYPLAFDAEVLLRLFLMGLFTYLFARRLPLDFWPSMFAGVAVLLMSYAIFYGNHAPVKVVSLMPLMFYAFQRLLERTSAATVGFAALAVGLSLLTDFAEMSFCVLQLAVPYYVLFGVLQVVRAERRGHEAARLAGGMAAALGLGFALGLPVILPLLENISLSESGHQAEFKVGAAGWEAAQWFLTFFPARLAIRPYQPSSYYATVFLLALAAPFALWRSRQARVAGIFFVIAGLFFYAKTLGWPLTQWLGELPVYRRVTLMKYLPPLVEFSLAIAAAVTVQYLLKRRRGTPLIVAGALLLGGLLGFLLFKASLSPSAVVPLRHVLLPILFVGAAAATVLACDTLRLDRRWLGLGLVGALAFEVTVMNRDVGRPLRHDPYLPPPFVQFLQQQEGPFRVFGNGETLFPNIASAYGIDDVRHISALNPLRRRTVRKMFDSSGSFTFNLGTSEPVVVNRFMNLLNPQYILTVGGFPPETFNHPEDRPCWAPPPSRDRPAQAPLPQLELVYSQEVQIFRNNWAHPRAMVVYRAELASSLEDAAARMQRPGFRPDQQVVLEGMPPGACDPKLLAPGPLPVPTFARVTGRSANSMRIKATCDKPGVLLVSEMYWPGWQAQVDGKPASIYPTDAMLRGIYLEPGDHEVVMTYRPRSFLYGMLAASAATMILVGWCGMAWRRRKRGGEVTPEGSIDTGKRY